MVIEITCDLNEKLVRGKLLTVGEDINQQQADLFIELGRAKPITDQGDQADQGEPAKQGRKQK